VGQITVTGSWVHHYWSWVGGNIGAMPLQAVITAAGALVLRKPIRRGWHALVGERADLEDVKRMAAAAHRIAADLHEHVTGERHQDAPETRE
jgi:predicted short-subunit dehydrogenase-like oxidoreductase (DUF2520 family)